MGAITDRRFALWAPAAWVGFFASAALAADFVLVEDGVSRAPIVVFEGAPPFTMQAANELAEYIEKVGGARPALIVGEPDPVPDHAVWVGYQSVLEELFPVLDFNFLFTTNPGLAERGIGLQPEAFADFHFNREDQANRPRPSDVVLITTSHKNYLPTLLWMPDGNPESRWTTGAYQEPGMWLEMRFAQPKEGTRLTMTGNHPATYEVCVDYGGGWEDRPRRIGARQAAGATIEFARGGPIARVKIEVSEPREKKEWWVISELTVNGGRPVLF